MPGQFSRPSQPPGPFLARSDLPYRIGGYRSPLQQLPSLILAKLLDVYRKLVIEDALYRFYSHAEICCCCLRICRASS